MSVQGPIAQALALTCVGNAHLIGRDVSGFWPDASVFRFSKACDFRRVEGEHDVRIAADPLAWFETLRAWRGLRLHTAPRPRGPQQSIPISERQSVGFVGGGPAWIIEAVGAERSTLWQGCDRIGERNHPQHKIWLTTYLMSGETAPQAHAQAPLQQAARSLDEALREIEEVAAAIMPDWVEIFRTARTALSAADPSYGYHADIADYAGFGKEQRQILAAVTAGWVFGAMGSWNDMVPAQAHAADYERTSERLFRALIEAICALANSTFDG